METRKMAILAECDICGNQHRVKDGMVGSTFKCKDCGVRIPVPDGTLNTSFDERVRRSRRDISLAAGPGHFAIAGVVAILVTMSLIAVMWMFVNLVQSITKSVQAIPSEGAERR